MSVENTINAARSAITGLTLQMVLLTLLLSGGGVLLYGLWEARAIWAPVAWQSPTLMGLIGGGSLLLLVGWILSSQQRRLVSVQDALFAQLKDQANDMHEALKLATTEMNKLRSEVAAITDAERRCQDRVRELERKLIEDRNSFVRRVQEASTRFEDNLGGNSS